jgi:acetylglutamate kinase
VLFCAFFRAPLTHDKNGQLLNTHTIASELAIALSTLFDVTLSYCFEKSGVLRDSEDDTSVIATMNAELYSELKEETIHSGMIPKLDNCQ